MTSTVKVLPLTLNDLGVSFRDTDKNYLPELDWLHSDKMNAIARIKPDQQGEYTITDGLIETASHGALYDNHNLKVLEWHRNEEGRLVIQSYTDKQVNLCAALKVQECFIKAKGPLLIQGAIDSESTVAIEAEAIWIADGMTSKESIFLNAPQGIGLFASVQAKNLELHGAYIHQDAAIQLSEQLDVSAQCFKQGDAAVTSANELCFVAKQCEMSGDLTVNNKCFLSSNALYTTIFHKTH